VASTGKLLEGLMLHDLTGVKFGLAQSKVMLPSLAPVASPGANWSTTEVLGM